jgi:penicillin-binding protein 2
MLSSANFEDRHSFLLRLQVMRIAVIVAFALIAVAFWIFQVVEHRRYLDMADNQHRRNLSLPAPRGVLFDRNMTLLVENHNSFTIAIVREQSADLNAAVTRLAAAVGVDEAKIAEIVANAKRRRDPSYRPIPVVEHATDAQVAAVIARRLELPEVIVQQIPTRKYPGGGLAAHLFGYVNEIQERDLQRPEFANLQSGAIVGQTGIERSYNSLLQGVDGSRVVAVNSKGREIEELGEEDPIDGDRLQLTIDLDLQKALEASFAHAGYAGAGVFLDPRTGEVLALTSLPGYDPNAFASGMDRASLTALLADPLKPFQNRLLQGRYHPGSTFKIVMSIAALETGVITPDFKVQCNGSKVFYGRPFKCSRQDGAGHGLMDVRHALEKSCNVFFYTVGDMMKIDTIHEYAAKLGLVGKTGIDLPGELDSSVPSTEWKAKLSNAMLQQKLAALKARADLTPDALARQSAEATRLAQENAKWYPGETISVSIGQGAVEVTPLSLATMVATVANGGTLVTPHVLKAVNKGGQGWVPAGAAPPKSTLLIKPENLQAVRDGLWMVVNGAGTAGRARIDGYDISGKTGTAQVISNEGKRAAQGKTDKDLRDHGFFVFFAPRDNPQIAGIVFAEHGEHGSTAAGITRHVLDTYFAKKEGRPLPVLPPKPAPAAIGAPPPGTGRTLAPAVANAGRGGGGGR